MKQETAENPASIGAVGGHTARQRRGIRLTVIAVLLISSTLVGGFFYSFTKARVMTKEQLREQGAFLYENPRLLPNFNLLDDTGKALTPSALSGQWHLIFFGFINCPDICPTTLAQLKTFYAELEPDVRADTKIWLASVDPARDTPEKMHAYLAFFDPEFRGITGEFLDVHRLATALNIPFTKVPGGGENYQVEHSGNVALINPAGHSVGFFKAPLEIGKMTRSYLGIRHYFE